MIISSYNQDFFRPLSRPGPRPTSIIPRIRWKAGANPPPGHAARSALPFDTAHENRPVFLAVVF